MKEKERINLYNFGNGPNTNTNPISARRFEFYLDKIVFVAVYSGTKLRGKLIELNESFLILEHRDGRRTLVRLKSIDIISEIPMNEHVEVV